MYFEYNSHFIIIFLLPMPMSMPMAMTHILFSLFKGFIHIKTGTHETLLNYDPLSAFQPTRVVIEHDSVLFHKHSFV